MNYTRHSTIDKRVLSLYEDQFSNPRTEIGVVLCFLTLIVEVYPPVKLPPDLVVFFNYLLNAQCI